MPTQAVAYAVLSPEGALGVGRVKVPVTPVQVAWTRMVMMSTSIELFCIRTHRCLADGRAGPVVEIYDIGLIRR